MSGPSLMRYGAESGERATSELTVLLQRFAFICRTSAIAMPCTVLGRAAGAAHRSLLQLTCIVIKPDGIACLKGTAILEFLRSHGLRPVAVQRLHLAQGAGSSQDTAPPAQLHTVAIGGPDRAKIGLSADSIVKEDGRTGGYASVIHLKGNVQIRTCCAQLPPQQQAKPRKSSPAQAYIIMTADEADESYRCLLPAEGFPDDFFFLS